MRAQTFEGTVEFLLLDGASTDSTPAKLAQVAAIDPRFRVVHSDSRSIPHLLNLGLGLARGELIARMDAHTLFPRSYLDDGARRLRAGDVASVGGPQVASRKHGSWSLRVALALESWLGRGEARFRQVRPGEIELDSGFCGMWERSLLIDLGGWNESASRAEDVELAARIRRAGGRIVCLPAMAARYLPRASLRGLAMQYSRYAYYRARIARAYPEVLRRSHVLPPTVVLTLAAAGAAPMPASRFARRALTLYGAALMVESARVGQGESPRDVLALPAVFVTMHLAWGAGFLVGCVRHGPPWTALGRQFRGRS